MKTRVPKAFWGVGVGLAWAIVVPSAHAQQACELHVWPAPPLETLTEGLVWNNVRNSAFTNPGERNVPREGPLTATEQLDQLELAGVAAISGMPGATLVRHADPAPTQHPDERKARRTGSTAACYAELSVEKLVYSRTPIAGRSLRALFAFSRFSADAGSPQRFASWTSRELTLFPARTKPEEAPAAAELRTAFIDDLKQFAAFRDRPEKKH